MFDVLSTRTPVRYKFSPQSVFRMPNSDFRTQSTNKHVELSHSGAVKLSPEMYLESTECQKSRS